MWVNQCAKNQTNRVFGLAGSLVPTSDKMIPAFDHKSDEKTLEMSMGISSALEFSEPPRKRTAYAPSQQIPGKIETPRLDSTTAYIYQEENEVQPPDDLVRTTYCMQCINVRGTPGYHERVASLMTRLWCSGCKAKHLAVQFSVASRKATTSSRLYIAHQGHLAGYLYLKVSLKDLESWQNVVGTKSIDCTDLTCLFPGASLKYTGISDFYADLDGTAYVAWLIPVNKSDADTSPTSLMD